MAVAYIPPLLRHLSGGTDRITVSAGTLRGVIAQLEAAFPGMAAALVKEDDLMPGMAASIDGAFSNRGLLATVREESEVHFLPALGGG